MPAPWKASKAGPLGEVTITGPRGLSGFIAQVQGQANANLIAAAPDLYEALKAAQFGFNHRRCSLCGGWNMSPQGETDMAHTKACVIAKALTKAEGKSNG